LYDHVGPYQTRRDVDFWVGAARSAGGRTLELGSGTGRVLLPIARAGCEISGLDRSRTMHDRCRENLAREPEDVRQRVRLYEGDMREFDLGARFYLIIAPFRSFQHQVTVEDQLRCLASIHRHLETGGRLIFDVFNPSFHAMVDTRRTEEKEDTPDTALPDGRRFRRATRVAAVHFVEQISDIEIIYYLTNLEGHVDRIVQSFAMRWYVRSEVEHLLARSGFTLRQVYGDYDNSELTDKSPEMVFVAEKS
jgi:SAM-dependent methyltransferase